MHTPGDGIALIGSHSQPGLIYGRTEGELLHPVTLTLVNWGKPQRAGWNYDGKPGGTVALSRGINTVEVNIPEGYEGRTVDFEVHPNLGKACRRRWKSPRRTNTPSTWCSTRTRTSAIPNRRPKYSPSTCAISTMPWNTAT